MRFVILVSLAALALPVGLCGCQSCVDDSSGSHPSANSNPAPPRPNNFDPGSNPLRVRPHMVPIPGRRMGPPPDDGGAEPPPAPSASAPGSP
jgi:hypothetical protein